MDIFKAIKITSLCNYLGLAKDTIREKNGIPKKHWDEVDKYLNELNKSWRQYKKDHK